jgi:hypothetical protein
MEYDIFEECKIGDEVYVYKRFPFKNENMHGIIIDKKSKESIRIFEDVINYNITVKLENEKIIHIKDDDSSTFLDIYRFTLITQ